EAEVDGLGGAALVGGDFVQLAPEYFRRGCRVDVGAIGERTQQALVARQVGHDPQFDLRVVAGHQHVALVGDEGAADAAAVFGADGDVLKVRVRRRQPAGGGARLVE